MAQGLTPATPPEMEKLGDTLVKHFDGIAAYCDHPVRFGVVESLNTTIKGVIRRARGMRDETMLLLKLKWATAKPIRSARDLARFIEFSLTLLCGAFKATKIEKGVVLNDRLPESDSARCRLRLCWGSM